MFFNAFVVFTTVLASYLPIRALPDLRPRPRVTVPLSVRAVRLPAPPSPLQLVGAWVIQAEDVRFGGVSALTIDKGRFLAVTDRGAAIRFDFPTARNPTAELADLRHGPKPFGEKWSRDAESIAPDPRGGRGWWVGYEQNHSLWLYDPDFDRTLADLDLGRDDWRDNRGAEGLLTEDDHLLVAAENGRDMLRIGPMGVERLAFDAGAEVADAARAPDGSGWLLLRKKGTNGISQAIAPLFRAASGYRAGPGWTVPKGMFDNYEGMAVEALPGGDWRFWLITDDGHRILARTLLVALDYSPGVHSKSPATRAGLSKVQ